MDLDFIVGAECGSARAENRVEWSCELELQKNDEAEQSAEREVAERERSGEGGCRSRLERRAAFSPLTPGSHALAGSITRTA